MNKRILQRIVVTLVTLCFCISTGAEFGFPLSPSTSSPSKNETTHGTANATSKSTSISSGGDFDLSSSMDGDGPKRSGGLESGNLKYITSISTGRTSTIFPSVSTTSIQDFGGVTSRTTTKKTTDDDDKGWNGPVLVTITISVTFVVLVLISIFLGFCVHRGRRRRRFGEYPNNSNTVVTVVNHQEIYLEHINSTSTLDTTVTK